MEETKSCGSDTCPIAKKETPKEALCTALYQTKNGQRRDFGAA